MTANLTGPEVGQDAKTASPNPQGTFPDRPCVALAGNPNAGKTTIFNALTGLRAKTSNYPGTTVERRSGMLWLADQCIEVVDLPGLYSLNDSCDDERVARDVLLGDQPGSRQPDVVVLIVDATSIQRNLFLASQILELGLPTVVVLNMVDLARKRGLRVDDRRLSQELGCPVIPMVASRRQGMTELRQALAPILAADRAEDCMEECTEDACPRVSEVRVNCSGCPFRCRFDWAERIDRHVVDSTDEVSGERTDALDRALTHPVGGMATFLAVMFAVFAMIFWIAEYPMEGIEWLFGAAGEWLGQALPSGELNRLVTEGVIGGVGGVLVFLPQICLLFFFLCLLEDTGYMARAAFVMDRVMRRVGLPGKAFVPLLSAHACALPAIMAARSIENKRDRLATILILPLMSCSARIPVYAMLVALLFPANPLLAAAAFTGAYGLGLVTAMVMAWMFKLSLLKGETAPLVIELPSYKRPSLRNALMMMLDRAMIFIKRAGTLILVASILLWALSNYPRTEPPTEVASLQTQARQLAEVGDHEQAQTLRAEADQLRAQSRLAGSVAARLGRGIEPVIAPLGFDWQIGVGVISSFAARELIVSTLAIVHGVGGNEAEEGDSPLLLETLRQATRDDGTALFTAATSASLLVFYVLALQCVPTLIVTRRETGGWKWPVVQLLYMSALAYLAAFVTYQLVATVSGLY